MLPLARALEKRLGKELPNCVANIWAPERVDHTEEDEDRQDQYFSCHPGESDHDLVLLWAKSSVEYVPERFGRNSRIDIIADGAKNLWIRHERRQIS